MTDLIGSDLGVTPLSFESGVTPRSDPIRSVMR